MTTIGMVGSRRRNTERDFESCRDALLLVTNGQSFTNVQLVSGGCPQGGDRFAERLARLYDIPIRLFPANWKLGRHAGFMRNTDIARESDLLIACVAPDRTGGTEDTIKKFQKFYPTRKLILV